VESLPGSAPSTRTGERRALERVACRSFRVAGAEVDIQRVLFGLLPWMKVSSCDVDNVSKGGMAFECRFGLAPGETLEMQLWVPGFAEPIALKGEVRWCKRARYGTGHRVGVQFAPFGSSASMNTRAALTALRALESNHL
jgi:hypothetical protein